MFFYIVTAVAAAAAVLAALSLPAIQKRQYVVVKPRRVQRQGMTTQRATRIRMPVVR